MNKRPELRTEAEVFLETELRLAPKAKAANLITVLSLLLTVFGLGAALILLPDNAFSEQENRYLQAFPKIQSSFSGTLSERVSAGRFLDRLFDGRFTGEMGDWCADQFPMRDLFVGLKGAAETAAGKRENDDVILGSDGYLIARDDYASADAVLKNRASIEIFAAEMAARGVPLTTAIAGRKTDVLTDRMPALFPADRCAHIWDVWEDGISPETGYLSLKDRLLTAEERGDGRQYYYRTDHHWTSWGAYEGYLALAEAWGIEPVPETALTEETVSEGFYGTTWSSAGMKWIAPDTMTYLRYDGDTGYTTSIEDTGVSYSGFYDRSFLDVKDKYSSFISGNNAVVRVTKDDGGDRGKLLLIKDSFGHSMVPFLAAHYDLLILDLRYYKQPVVDLVESEGIDRVLILCNMASMEETNVHAPLTFGLG